MVEIIKNIFINSRLDSKNKIKSLLLYLSRRRGVGKAWQNRYQRILEVNKFLDQPCDSSIESKHQRKWSTFRKKADLTTLRVCHNISGTTDSRIIPEDIFAADLEPTLINDNILHFFSHKSFYNRWFLNSGFPKDIFHRIQGEYYDCDFNKLSLSQLKKSLGEINFPVVLKPNKDTYGGSGICFVEDADHLFELCRERKNFVVQEQIQQHPFFERYHPVGLNTVRAYVYKSVSDDTHYILNATLRMGKGGSLDNESSGGIHTMIRDDGSLNGYAVDKHGTKYLKHPDSGLAFDDKIPEFKSLKELSKNIARQVYFGRVVGLDLCFDKDGRWRVVEVNTKGHTIRFSQYAGEPFFGEFTDEVIEYCRKNHWTLQ
ncbi:hypothetical protein CK503_14235 [Aliifodinibius salipaludis]|uniref:ATP-grasp domain-containing protein n=1 Tax=Fodinibius salipaludis TaxID=2032627 RepID=A0A2A2G7N0_9BACT|nr:sugar-transfer associated ATP-grasp domain-containing protein [Aliifodinibius salipaludis]PAU92843.1 hypothetical protein CK503_14235 [Aliifodinibius salipaludis]